MCLMGKAIYKGRKRLTYFIKREVPYYNHLSYYFLVLLSKWTVHEKCLQQFKPFQRVPMG